MSCFCDYDPADFYIATIRKARKPHSCFECGGQILHGEKYEHVSGKWEGRLDTFVTCERCCDIRQWVKNNLPCFCWAHGNMLDDAAEEVDEAYWHAPAETVGLRFGFLRRRVLLDKFNASRRRLAA